MKNGAAAGIVAATAWAVAEPVVGRVFRTPYSDVRLLGRAVTRGPLWWPTGFALHLLNGAAFGAAFARAGGRGWKRGVLAAQLENAALWPGMAVVDRAHPDRKSGAWPPLARNPRIVLYEVTMHAVFGGVLGALLRDEGRPRRRNGGE